MNVESAFLAGYGILELILADFYKAEISFPFASPPSIPNYS